MSSKLDLSKFLPKAAVLKRITGLKNTTFSSKPSKHAVPVEVFKRKDKDYFGELLEEFDGNVIPGAITGLAPYWNELKDTYWVQEPTMGNTPILDELVSRLRFRFPKNYIDKTKAGQIIRPQDVDTRNYSDPFFQNEATAFREMEGGTYIFDLQDPLDILLFFIYKHDPRVLVRDGRQLSKYVVGKAEYELILPEKKVVDDKAQVVKEMELLGLLSNMSFDKRKIVGRILRLSRIGDYNNPDPDVLLVELSKATKDDKRVQRWETSTQQKFSELAKMPNEDLMLHLDIEKAISLRIITSNRNTYYLNSEKLEGVDKYNDLFKFFRAEGNGEKYKDLAFLIDEKQK